MTDRYLKAVLTVIAGALIYLCVILTPMPGVQAQVPSRTPGEPSGPTSVVVVGVTAPIEVTGKVTTERSSGVADRVVITGWEEESGRQDAGAVYRRLPRANTASVNASPLPVKPIQ